jgi:MoxR-like ATPase
VSNQTYVLPDPFFVLATQNPLEMEGTYPLPEAQLDRFIFKVDVPFPSPAELNQILDRTTGTGTPATSIVCRGPQLLAMQTLARAVPIAAHVSDYVSRLVVATHPGDTPVGLVRSYVRYGASPRGGQAIVLGAKIRALLDGRYNVSFDDVDAEAPAALRHRLLLNFEGQAEGIRPDDVIAELVNAISRE